MRMATIAKTRAASTKTAAPKVTNTIVGVAWLNEVKTGNNAGKQFLTLKLDRGTELGLTDADTLFLYPRQNFREGKKDSDYLVCVQEPA